MCQLSMQETNIKFKMINHVLRLHLEEGIIMLQKA
jgi:hypothetical protein